MKLPIWKKQSIPPEILRFSNVPSSKWEVSLDKIPVKYEYHTVIADYFRDLRGNLERGRGLLLCGPYGSGKSSIAAIILREVVAHGCDGYWLEAFELADGWRGKTTSKERDRRFVESRRSHLLVVDDLGMEDDRDATRESYARLLVRQALRYRLEREGATIITTNLTVENLERMHGDKLIALLKRHITPVLIEGMNWGEPEVGA